MNTTLKRSVLRKSWKTLFAILKTRFTNFCLRAKRRKWICSGLMGTKPVSLRKWCRQRKWKWYVPGNGRPGGRYRQYVMEPILLTERCEYEYLCCTWLRAVYWIFVIFRLDIRLRVELQRELFGNCVFRTWRHSRCQPTVFRWVGSISRTDAKNV